MKQSILTGRGQGHLPCFSLALLVVFVGGLSPVVALDLADPAPPLEVAVWVQGEPVAPAAGGETKFVVVAFWATWCGPSVRAIPHLTALQERFAERGVVVVGVTSVDPNNSVKKIRKFVAAQGEAMPYRVAVDDGDRTWKKWMQAAGQKALSTAFVVDGAGRIAWIGTPGPALDRALEEIVSGRWSAEEVRRIRDLERSIEASADRSEWEAALAESDRLVEAGSRFVTVVDRGWDTHQNIARNLPDARFRGSGKLPGLDRAYATLLTDLRERGLLDSTLVVLMGEFGRTPKINNRAGRDHWPRAGFVCFAGGGVKGGQVIGATDAHGEVPADTPVRPEDVAHSMLKLLGVDPHKEYIAPGGRPLKILDKGQMIPGLA